MGWQSFAIMFNSSLFEDHAWRVLIIQPPFLWPQYSSELGGGAIEAQKSKLQGNTRTRKTVILQYDIKYVQVQYSTVQRVRKTQIPNACATWKLGKDNTKYKTNTIHSKITQIVRKQNPRFFNKYDSCAVLSQQKYK